jgi:hypothetical protein
MISFSRGVYIRHMTGFLGVYPDAALEASILCMMMV